MSPLRAWLQAARLLVQPSVAAALLLGQALAFSATRAFSWRIFALVQLFGVLAGLFVAFTGQVADLQIGANDADYRSHARGWRAVQSGLGGFDMAKAALGLSLAMGGLGAWLSLRERRPFALVVVACAVLLPWLRDFPPLELTARGGGALAEAIWLGGVLPLFAFYMQARDFDSLDWRALVPALLVAYAAAIFDSLSDFEADRAGNRHGFAARRGRQTARRAGLAGVALAIAVAPFALHVRSLAGLAAIVVVPVAAWLVSVRRALRDGGDAGVIAFGVAAVDVALAAWAAGLILR
jgi:1,4-dihydroxy-2-naphthoate polyprenyltransferase